MEVKKKKGRRKKRKIYIVRGEEKEGRGEGKMYRKRGKNEKKGNR